MRGRGDENTLLTIVNRFVGNLRRGHNVINALMTPQQRELMSRLQALMALAEGYSNHVMNHVGADSCCPTSICSTSASSTDSAALAGRAAVPKITGLSLKMEQYRLGERFVDEVVRAARHRVRQSRLAVAREPCQPRPRSENPERWIGADGGGARIG